MATAAAGEDIGAWLKGQAAPALTINPLVDSPPILLYDREVLCGRADPDLLGLRASDGELGTPEDASTADVGLA